MELGRDVFNFRIPLWCIFTIAQSHNQSRLPRAVMTLAASIRDNSSASAASTLLQSHNSTISYFHNFTISQFITVVKIEPIDIDIYFHRLENAKAGLSPGLAPPQQCLGGWLERIVPNIFLGRNGVWRQNRIKEAA